MADLEKMRQTLSGIPLFSQLRPDLIEKIASLCKPIIVEEGEIIITEGENGKCLFIILKGSVSVFHGESKNDDTGLLSVLTEGDFFGEMALFDNAPRSASVVADEETSLIALEKEDFLELATSEKEVSRHIFSVLSSRIRENEALLQSISQENFQNEIQSEEFTRDPSLWGRLFSKRLPQSGQKIGSMIQDQDKKNISAGFDEEALGKLLLRKGKIDSSQLVAARRAARRAGIDLPRMLLNMNFVQPHVLSRAIESIRSQSKLSAADDTVLKQLLIKKKWWSQELEKDFSKRADENESLVDFLLKKEDFSAEDLSKMKEIPEEIPWVNLDTYPLEKTSKALIPIPLIFHHRVIPLSKKDNTLILATGDPGDLDNKNLLQTITGFEIEFYFAPEKQITEKIQSLYGQDENSKSKVLRDKIGLMSELVNQWEQGAKNMGPLLEIILESAMDSKASDIHIEPHKPQIRVRCRIDGILKDIFALPYELHKNMTSAIKIRSDMDISDKLRPQDGKFSYHTESKHFLIRVSTLPTQMGEKVVMRLHAENDVTIGLRELGLDDRAYLKLEAMVQKPYGMVLVTGPVGSGKTTTLYSILNSLDVLEKNIVTIEDPIEYELPGINHVQVNLKTGLDYVQGLKSILRQDPNVIMVGEIRDAESAKISTRAACTGVLMLSTLHTNDAPSTLTALCHMGVEPFFLVGALNVVVAQRLVRTVCDACAETYVPSLSLVKSLGLAPDKEYLFQHGNGCSKCFHTGYKGRIGIFEVMIMNEKIRDLMLNRVPEAEIKKAALEGGMQTLWGAGVNKIIKGRTTPEELLRVVIREEIVQ